MRTVTLNGMNMKNLMSMYRYLGEEMLFSTPVKNMDDLWDQLMAIDFPTYITLVHSSAMLEEIYEEGEELIQTFYDACIENQNLGFTVQEEPGE